MVNQLAMLSFPQLNNVYRIITIKQIRPIISSDHLLLRYNVAGLTVALTIEMCMMGKHWTTKNYVFAGIALALLGSV